MINSKFFILLRQLTPRELTRFGEYIDSPIFNKHKEITFLCHYVLRYAPEFTHDFLDKTHLYKKVFPGKLYDLNKLHVLFSKSLKLLQDYLILLQSEKDVFKREVYLMEQLSLRKVDKHFNTSANRYKQLRNSLQSIEAATFLNDFLYQQQLDQFFLSKDSRAFDNHLQLKNDNLDLYYLIEKMKIACDMASRSNLVQGEYFCSLLDQILTYLEQNSEHFEYVLILQVYMKIYSTLTESETESNYFQLKNLLYKGKNKLAINELNEMYGYALNYCIKKINKGKKEYYRELFELYQFLIEHKIIFQNGFLLQSHFKNVVTIGLRLQEMEKIKDFIETYKKALHPSVRANAYAYNMASYFYSCKLYKEALNMLFDVEFTETAYHLGAKIIQLKSYYELNESEALHSLIDAFKIYVKRSKQFSEYWKSSNFNFIKLTKRCFDLKQQKQYVSKSVFRKKSEELERVLNYTTSVANRDWLEDIYKKLLNDSDSI